MLGGRVVAALLGALSGGAPIPTPIGVGPLYRLPAAPARVAAAEPVGRFRCGATARPRVRAHVELFANRRVLILPAGIGMAPPLARDGAYVTRARCSYAVRTTTPTGVIEVVAAKNATIGDLFRVWGQPLTRARLAGFRGRVHAYVARSRWRGDIRAIPLRRHAQIVLEIGGYVRPHRFFLFGRGG
ncbi:MAG: hypothetical protein E6G60_05785 [Actinobacteria bacterium]|nr:MAG: hypothetical protein E6G60_05785 [Actinomycetota bacterium]